MTRDVWLYGLAGLLGFVGWVGFAGGCDPGPLTECEAKCVADRDLCITNCPDPNCESGCASLLRNCLENCDTG